ncbi:MAG: heavy metal-binding domain-containing protein [Acidobacteria bacterium]|nr:heavy metal-binding domain-containing protein [Acidobacteriota bacterium]
MIALIPLFFVLVGFIVGSLLETRHFESIREREAVYRTLPTLTFETLPEGWRVQSSGLACGSVVVSMDYFKRLLTGLRSLVGGRIRALEPLLDRGRREAVLRMQENAVQMGFEAIINVRLETAQLDTTGRSGVAGVEMLAYGTAIRFDRSHAPAPGRESNAVHAESA